MLMVLVVDVLKTMYANFRSLTLRINAVEQQLVDFIVNVYKQYYAPQRLEILLQ